MRLWSMFKKDDGHLGSFVKSPFWGAQRASLLGEKTKREGNFLPFETPALVSVLSGYASFAPVMIACSCDTFFSIESAWEVSSEAALALSSAVAALRWVTISI